MDNGMRCGDNCDSCLLDGCCALQYARSVGIPDRHIHKMSELSRKAAEKMNHAIEELSTKTAYNKYKESFSRLIDRGGDGFLDGFPSPELFNLVQSYRALAEIGESFDLKERYYQYELGIVIRRPEEFKRNLIAEEIWALKIHALILQRADQLLTAVDGQCTKDGICEKCWVSEVCGVETKRRRDDADRN